MKDIRTAPFMIEFTKMTTNMYRLGYNEGSGGNISYILYEDELKDYLDLNNVIREIPISFKADELIGKYFLVTATGSYFKNIETDPEYSLGIVRIKEDGTTAQLLWGFRCDKNFTSEFPTHLMTHIERLKIDPNHRVVLHCHPLATVAMTYIHPLNDRDFTRTLWKMNQECIVVFPDGVGVLPWMLCGTNEIGIATAEKMKHCRIVLWSAHGIYGVGANLDQAFGLVETVEKSAQIYMMVGSRPVINPLKDDDLKQIVNALNLDYRKDFLD